MRKIIVLLLALVLIVSMSVTTFAVTPKVEYKPVKLPQIKIDTSFAQSVVSNWLKTNPIDFSGIKITHTNPVLN